MTEEQNKLADELDAEVKNERSGKIANLMMRASAALRAEPATEAVLEAAREKIDSILLGALSGSEKKYRNDGGYVRWGLVQEDIHRALKGKGASQGAKRCSKCGEDITFRLMCSTLGCPLHSPAADEQKG